MSDKKVLLLNPNQMKPVVAPIAIDYLAHSLYRHGIGVEFLDLAFSNDVEEAIKGALKHEPFFVVGITIRNIDDSYYASQDFCLKKIKEIINLVKLHTTSPLVLGGVGFSIAPIPALKYCDVNLGVWGEGEVAFPLLIKTLSQGDGLEKIPGLLWREGNTYRKNPPSFLDLTKVSLAQRDTIDNIRYFREGGMVGFETKRGCNQHCYYCADPVAKGKTIRLRSPEDVASELKGLAEKGVSCFHTCDSEFNVPPDHALQVCKAIVAMNLENKINWYAYANPFGFSKELAFWMRKAGCVGIDFGIDSGNERMLKKLGRNHTPDDIRKVAKLCHDNGFAFMFDLLLGGPGENRETVRETIEVMKKVNPSRVGISLGVRIYPETYFGDCARKTMHRPESGFFGTVRDEMLEPLFYLSPDLGEDIQGFIRKLVDGDNRFFFGGTEGVDENYNYNDNIKLVKAIKQGHRGAFWDILRRIEDTL